MLELFGTKDTIAVAAALTLEEVGAKWTLRKISFAKAEQTLPDYLTVNPKGRVPALVTPHGVLTETGAIQQYLAETHPNAGLIPSDPFQAAKMREMMFYIASTFHVNHAHKMRGARWADLEASRADMTAKVTETMTASAAYVEDFLQGPFVLGDAVSLADPYLFVACRWARGDGVDMSQFPKFTAFEAAYAARPAVARVRELGLMD